MSGYTESNYLEARQVNIWRPLQLPMLVASLLNAALGDAGPRAVAQEASPTAGIANRYPGDKGIEADPQVVFTENFEQPTLESIGARWDTVRNRQVISLSPDVPCGGSGTQSLLISRLAEKGTAGDFCRRLDDGYDQLYTRMYVKFADDCKPLHHFGTCVGGNNPATRWPTVRAGEPTKGDRVNFKTAPGGDPFEGFRFRTAEPLKINFVWLYVYITQGTPWTRQPRLV